MISTIATTQGVVAECDGIFYLLTDCCGASGKGGATGVICRQCYRPVGDRHGAAADSLLDLMRQIGA